MPILCPTIRLQCHPRRIHGPLAAAFYQNIEYHALLGSHRIWLPYNTFFWASEGMTDEQDEEKKKSVGFACERGGEMGRGNLAASGM